LPVFVTVNASTAFGAPGDVIVALPDDSATVRSIRLSTTNVVFTPALTPGVVLPVGELSITVCGTPPTE
jgi:SOS-response transcriptional repressor LexA